MNNSIIILISIILVGVIGIFFAYRFLKAKKKKAKKQKEIPEETLGIFNEVENNMKGGIKKDGTIQNPYEILWRIARRNCDGKDEGSSGNIIRTEQPTTSGEICEQPIRRESIQTRDVKSIRENKHVTRKNKPSNIRRTISRIRRGKTSSRTIRRN